ncbi:MAG: hypothetical protein HY788_16035 [Deltaproteobacteria bacterium]|nr:hypothetical protein [Deltaproteobacteria bacterium]
MNPTHLNDVLRLELNRCGLVERSFLLHGTRLTVRSNSSFLLDAVEQGLAYYSQNVSDGPAEIEFLLLDHPLSELGSLALTGSPVLHFDSEVDDEQGITGSMGLHLKYYTWETLEVADFGPTGQLFVDPSGTLGVALISPCSSPSPRALNYIFSLGLASLLRMKGRYFIHAAGLAENGKGVIIPASSGRGKTTLSLALVRGGFQFLGDDRLLIERAADHIRVLGFLESVNVTDETISLFQEIRCLPEKAFGSSARKKNFRLEQVYPGCTVESCNPEVLLFPSIIDEGASRVEPAPKMEAVVGLLPHSLLVLDKEVARSHFQLLCRMVERMHCYRLYFGRDFREVPHLVRELL